MSVKIRLATVGKKNQIAYRIVATDTHTKRDGKFLEILGFYNPKSNAVEKLRIEKDKIDSWVKKGAIITPAVALLIEKGTLDRPKKPKVKEETTTAPAAQTPPEPIKAEESTQPAEEAKEEAVEEKLDQEPEAKAEESKGSKPAEISGEEKPAEEPKEEPKS